ncbi:hypothetical protein QBC32DRAFT_251974 [Pseudoneurospora amorphoporcata]|uniref:Amidohydrolase-related domain-containing protein n=1 Tax=Pseudoneurospora amorphoporcata TaxID=241081 RepID=A0AAN6P1K0_9PEZI|nr:hypothetical protein QBC32DRAFT_251974 [Pseudoneurospora amorphoporcata]
MTLRVTPPSPPKTFTVHSSLLFDPKQKAFRKNISIEINRDTGSIANVYERNDGDDFQLLAGDIDLRGAKCVLPGLVDSHTHVFLHSYVDRPSIEQMRDASPVERILRATSHVRAALLAGFTTYRDLGTEALGPADAQLRDCINRGLVPGPRMFVATDALASNGSYEIRRENKSLSGPGPSNMPSNGGLLVPRASDPCDGVDGVRAGVRRRVGDGADIIKFYADYRRKVMRFPGPGVSNTSNQAILFPPDDPRKRNPAVPLFDQDEMDAIVREAKLAELPVAAHAGETKAALMAARAGVTTVEHMFENSNGLLDETLREMKRQGTIWVPTLATVESAAPQFMEDCLAAVRKAVDAGVRVVTGGDTGVIDHGLNARELELFVKAGIKIEEVLEMATVGGWEACGGELTGYRFGWWEKGCRADIIALDADPREDGKALRKVGFVMKDGKVWKRDGRAVDMITVPEFPPSMDD